MNSTIIPKEKICKTCGQPAFLFSKGECKSCANITSFKRRTAAANLAPKLRKVALENNDNLAASRQALINEIDAVMSRYIRIRQADKDGFLDCFTCIKPNRIHWTFADCSHYIPRGNMATRFEQANCRAACKKCNQLEYGKLEVFKDRLEADNKGITDVLLEMSREPKKWSLDELKSVLIDYRAKLKLVESKLIEK